jgi:hypothetical protein
MVWLVAVVLLLLGFAVVALGIGGAESPAHIRTFTRSSPAEEAFDRRAARLQVIGFASVVIALVIGLAGALELLS